MTDKNQTARGRWHTYVLPPIDFGWEHLPAVDRVAGEIARNQARATVHEDLADAYTAEAFLRDFEQAKSLARAVGWEGDYRGDEGPRVFWLPGDGAFNFAFVWKQDNNGTTFVVSPAPLHGMAEADFIELLAERMAEIHLLRADLDQTDKLLAARHVEFAAIKAADASWNGKHPVPAPLAARIDAYFDATNKIYLRSAALQDLIAELERRGRKPDDQASESPCSDYPRSPLVGPHLDEAIEEVVRQRVRAQLGAQPGDPL